MTVLLDIRAMTKTYPGVLACDDISLEIGTGEIHALLGENGAGKSTLVKMIYGLSVRIPATCTLKACRLPRHEPRAARADGIAMVFQHFSLFEALNVADNIALGMEVRLSRSDLASRIREVSAGYGLAINPDRIVGDLSAGERQRV